MIPQTRPCAHAPGSALKRAIIFTFYLLSAAGGGMNSQKNAGGILWHEHWFVPASCSAAVRRHKFIKECRRHSLARTSLAPPSGLIGSAHSRAGLRSAPVGAKRTSSAAVRCPSMWPLSGLIAQKAAGRCRFQTAPTNRDAQKMRHPRFVHNMFPSAMEWTVCPYSAAIGS